MRGIIKYHSYSKNLIRIQEAMYISDKTNAYIPNYNKSTYV